MIADFPEEASSREGLLPQPGGRAPAPGELALLQSFMNTHFDLVEDWGSDLLASPERLVGWFSGRDLIGDVPDLVEEDAVRRAIAVREGLRQLARMNRDPGCRPDTAVLGRLNEATGSVLFEIAFTPEGPVLSPTSRDEIDRALGVLVAVAARAMIDGRWRRLKACPGEHCGWVFYDRSRNNSGRWCSMAVCGGRTKAKAHYDRHRRGGD